MQAMLELRGVVAGYGGADILTGVELEVERGSFTCVVGPNGAGKSTVLKVLSGLVPPRRGSITMEGTEITGRDPGEIVAQGIVHVSQQGGLFPNLTVRENVLLGGYTLRRQRALIKRRYAEVAEIVPLVAERAGDRAGNLSGGQRRVVEFARCLMVEPSVVLLDEPSLGLDPRSLTEVYRLIRQMHGQGKTVVLVEQNVRLGLSVADHGVVMENGQVRLRGRADEVLRNPEIAELYLGGTVKHADRPAAPTP